jgi:hypothetical protein
VWYDGTPAVARPGIRDGVSRNRTRVLKPRLTHCTRWLKPSTISHHGEIAQDQDSAVVGVYPTAAEAQFGSDKRVAESTDDSDRTDAEVWRVAECSPMRFTGRGRSTV